MASHRKPRSRSIVRAGSPAVGLTTVALASVTLMTAGSATAAPRDSKPSIADVQKKVDDLYRQAGTATEQYDKAKESTGEQRKSLDSTLDDIARRTDKMNEARRTLGMYATAQYRQGAVTPTAALIFSDSPQSYFDQTHLMGQLSDGQHRALADFQSQQAGAAKKRTEATRQLQSLTTSQAKLKTSKQDVQKKLSAAQALLSHLTAEEKARLAALQKKRDEEAQRKADAKAKQEAAKRAEEAKAETDTKETGTDTSAGSGSTGSTTATSNKAEQALAFARAQIGKPYVWGATGPSSYDCSGLVQAAWKAAGVDLPRTTYDQVNAGTRVSTDDLQPGDLVFFFSDISHVGMYIGNGMMIHAPKPGAYVREESIYEDGMPIYGAVRPA